MGAFMLRVRERERGVYSKCCYSKCVCMCVCMCVRVVTASVHVFMYQPCAMCHNRATWLTRREGGREGGREGDCIDQHACASLAFSVVQFEYENKHLLQLSVCLMRPSCVICSVLFCRVSAVCLPCHFPVCPFCLSPPVSLTLFLSLSFSRSLARAGSPARRAPCSKALLAPPCRHQLPISPDFEGAHFPHTLSLYAPRSLSSTASCTAALQHGGIVPHSPTPLPTSPQTPCPRTPRETKLGESKLPSVKCQMLSHATCSLMPHAPSFRLPTYIM